MNKQTRKHNVEACGFCIVVPDDSTTVTLRETCQFVVKSNEKHTHLEVSLLLLSIFQKIVLTLQKITRADECSGKDSLRCL